MDTTLYFDLRRRNYRLANEFLLIKADAEDDSGWYDDMYTITKEDVELLKDAKRKSDSGQLSEREAKKLFEKMESDVDTAKKLTKRKGDSFLYKIYCTIYNAIRSVMKWLWKATKTVLKILGPYIIKGLIGLFASLFLYFVANGKQATRDLIRDRYYNIQIAFRLFLDLFKTFIKFLTKEGFNLFRKTKVA